MLIEHNGCYFVETELLTSFGYESLDPVGKEAFVNKIRIEGADREIAAMNIIDAWAEEMKAKWPNALFKIYLHRREDDIIIRFHRHRSGIPDWSSASPELSIISVG